MKNHHHIVDSDMVRVLSKLAGLRASRKAVKKEEEGLKEKLRAYMIQAGVKKVFTDSGYTAELVDNYRTYLDEERICNELDVEDLKGYKIKRQITSKLIPKMPKLSKSRR